MMIDDKQLKDLYNAIMLWLTAATKQASTEEKWTKAMMMDEDEEEIQLDMNEDWPGEFQDEWG